MPEIVRHVDIGIANEEDCQMALGISLGDRRDEGRRGRAIDLIRYRALCEAGARGLPQPPAAGDHAAREHSADHNGWSACLHDRTELPVSRRYEVTDIVDRVGTGDAFAAGLIYGLTTEMERVRRRSTSQRRPHASSTPSRGTSTAVAWQRCEALMAATDPDASSVSLLSSRRRRPPRLRLDLRLRSPTRSGPHHWGGARRARGGETLPMDPA